MKINYLLSILPAICFLIVFTACDKEDQEIGANKNLYFEANLAGKSLYLPEGKDGYISKAGASSIGNGPGCVKIQSISISKDDHRKSIEILFVKPQSDCPTTCAQDMAIVKEGTHTFGSIATTPDSDLMDGVVVAYTDVDGKVWRTDLGTGQQSNSNFSITKIEENTVDPFYKSFVTAEFNCTLYDGEGNEIEVTDGKIVSRAVLCS